MTSLAKQSLKLPQEQRQAWVAQKSREETQSQGKVLGKQVEAILNARQLEIYKKAVFPDLAAAMLHYPEFLKIIGATPEQKEQLAKIQQRLERQAPEEERRYFDQLLAVLSPQQQEKLRAEIRRAHEPAADAGTTVIFGGTIAIGNPLEINAPVTVADFPDTGMGIPAYGELLIGATRTQLGFTRRRRSDGRRSRPISTRRRRSP